jgi:hypothetical protein
MSKVLALKPPDSPVKIRNSKLKTTVLQYNKAFIPKSTGKIETAPAGAEKVCKNSICDSKKIIFDFSSLPVC